MNEILMIKNLRESYNLPVIHDHEIGKTIIVEPEYRQRSRMCLNWIAPLGEEFIPFDETKQTRLDFERNINIANTFARIMKEHDGLYLAADIDEETGKHTGVYVESSYTKPLYCISKTNIVLGWIETTCVDCPWQGGIGPDFKTLGDSFIDNGMKVLPPGKILDSDLEKVIPRSRYKWELITVS
jgi:hypothetical protein